MTEFDICRKCEFYLDSCKCDEQSRDEVQERIAIALEGILKYLETRNT